MPCGSCGTRSESTTCMSERRTTRMRSRVSAVTSASGAPPRAPARTGAGRPIRAAPAIRSCRRVMPAGRPGPPARAGAFGPLAGGPPVRGMRDGRPFGAFALVWALPAARRREIAWIELGDDATMRARGRQWCDGEPRYELFYELETSAGYITRRLSVSVTDGPAVTLERG